MGVSTHSEPNKAYVIFSRYRADRSPYVNAELHNSFLRNRKGLNFLELEGTYQGNFEKSILVPKEQFDPAWVWNFEQQSYLLLENHKHGMYKATFILKGGYEEFAGYFRSFRKDAIDALKLDYTYRKGTWFTIWPTDTTQLDALEAEIKARLIAAGL